MSLSAKSMDFSGNNHPAGMISSWVERFDASLFWIAFLHEGQTQRVIHNPARKAPLPGEHPLLAMLSETASELSSELCVGSSSQIVIVMENVQYVCFCQSNKPWLVIALDRAAELESFRMTDVQPC